MAQPDTQKPSRPLPWIILHLTFAVVVVLFTISTVTITGLDIITIFFKTSYRYYPILLFSTCGLLILLNLILALYGIVTHVQGTSFMSPMRAGILTLAMMALFLTTAAFFSRMHHPPVGAKQASARERFWTRIGPVVQFGPFVDRRADASTSMVIWYFDPFMNDEPALLRFGREPLPENMSPIKEAVGDGRRHEFHLTDLSPSTLYYYQVPAWGGGVRSFRTAPARGSNEPLRFMAMGDTGNTRRGGYAVSYQGEVLQAAGGWYGSMNTLPAFRVHVGDMVRSGSDLDGWHSHFSSDDQAASIPCVIAPGNHEILADGGANFLYFYGQPGYSVLDCGSARIFSIHPFDGPGRTLDGPVLTTGREQYRWLRQELARTGTAQWRIVVIHVPLLSSGDYGVNELLMAQYSDLFKEHAVDLVISGHDHNFDSFLVNEKADSGGTVYIVAGTGGSHLDSYIMDRPSRRWLDWRHDRNAPGGLYQHDRYTESYHRYGELSWGFTDVELRDNAMTVTYCRWLDFNQFLEMTGQRRQAWDMVHMDKSILQKKGLLKAMPVFTIMKKK